MEGRRVRKFGHQQLSPDRAKVWKERSPRYQQRQPEPEVEPVPEVESVPELQQKSSKVPVVYYLCRNRQLEHPHFIEVPLASSEGLFLKDVIEKLNVLRGKGMASMYSWSCKRSYKNGFVWHDLCEDDMILPANGNEYVLKGSELVEKANSDPFAPPAKLENLKQLPEPPPSGRSHDDISSSSSSSSTSMSGRDTKNSPDDELSPPESRNGCTGTPLADASTQTEETSMRGVLSDDVASSSSSKTGTLQSLILADASKYNGFKPLHESQTPVNAKIKATDMLMQLISCGSTSVKDHSFGLIPSYKPRFSDSKFQSPLFSTSVMLGELDCCTDSSRFMSMRLEDKDYFNGSSMDTQLLEEQSIADLKRSSSYNGDRSNNGNHVLDKEETTKHTKCIPILLKPYKQPTKPPIREGPRISTDSGLSSRIISPCPSNSSSKRLTDPCSSKKESGRLESFREENINGAKIEESLLQGLG